MYEINERRLSVVLCVEDEVLVIESEFMKMNWLAGLSTVAAVFHDAGTAEAWVKESVEAGKRQRS